MYYFKFDLKQFKDNGRRVVVAYFGLVWIGLDK